MENVTPAVPRRAVRWNVGIQLVMAAILLGAVNYFGFNHYGRWDFSRSQKFVLADQTKNLLRELKGGKPLHITVFFSGSERSPETALYPDVQNLLKELIFSSQRRVEVENINPTRDVSRARELQGKYRFGAEESLLILEYDGRVKYLPVADMAEWDLAPVASGDPPRLLAFKGEQAVTNALLALREPERLHAYFLLGHGEPAIEGNSPLSVFVDYIRRQNVETKMLSLSSLDAIPADCAVLALIAPQTDIDEREAAILRKFWSEQGRLLILLDPNVSTPNLNAALAETGITPRNDRVLRILNNPALPNIQGIWRVVTGEFLPTNAVTKRLTGLTITFPGETKSFALDLKEKNDANRVQVWPLIQAAEPYWGEMDFAPGGKTGVRYDEGRDAGYPVYLAAAAARGGVSDDRVEVESSKMVVVGNSEFALSASIQPQALDFLSSAMNWLLDRKGFTGTVPKSAHHFILNLTPRQLTAIAFYTMFAIPGAAALLGVIAWWRRRA